MKSTIMSQEDHIKEKDLCISLGISRDIIKSIRDEHAEDATWQNYWHRIESKKPKHLWEVRWTNAGVDKLKELLKLKPEEKIEKPSVKKGVMKARYKNNRMIQVEIEGKVENVLCRDSGKFIAGMPVWVKWDGARWVVNRHPRFNGKY